MGNGKETAASGDGDFKYVMQDVDTLYIGARLTWGELMEDENVPFKLKVIYEKLLKDSAPRDITLADHLWKMDADGFDYRVFHKLRLKLSAMCPREGKRGGAFIQKTFRIEAFAGRIPGEKAAEGMVIQEILLSKLALFSFTV